MIDDSMLAILNMKEKESQFKEFKVFVAESKLNTLKFKRHGIAADFAEESRIEKKQTKLECKNG